LLPFVRGVGDGTRAVLSLPVRHASIMPRIHSSGNKWCSVSPPPEPTNHHVRNTCVLDRRGRVGYPWLCTLGTRYDVYFEIYGLLHHGNAVYSVAIHTLLVAYA
jgi:hypothetical protein